MMNAIKITAAFVTILAIESVLVGGGMIQRVMTQVTERILLLDVQT